MVLSQKDGKLGLNENTFNEIRSFFTTHKKTLNDYSKEMQESFNSAVKDFNSGRSLDAIFAEHADIANDSSMKAYFEGIGKSADNAGEKIRNFNEIKDTSINASAESSTKTNKVSNAVDSVEGTKLPDIDSSASVDGLKNIENAAQNTGKAVGELGEELAETATVNATATASAAGFNASLSSIGATAGAVAVNIGRQALAIAASMGAALLVIGAVSLAIKGIQKIANHSKEVIKEGTDTQKKYAKEISTTEKNISKLEKNQTKFNTLAKGTNNSGKNTGGLTESQYDEYLKIRKEVLAMNPSLIAGYDAEGNAIANNNTLMQEAIRLQQEKLKAQQEESVNSENWEKQSEAAYEKQKKYKNKATGAIADYNNTAKSKEAVDELNSVSNDMFGFDFIQSNNGVNTVTTNTKNAQTALSNIDNFITELENRGNLAQDQIDSLKTLASDYESYSKKADDSVKSFLEKTATTVPKTVEGYDELSDSGKNFLENWITNQDTSNIDLSTEEKRKAFKNETEKFAEDIIGNTDIIDAYDKYNKIFADKSGKSAIEYEKSITDQYKKMRDAMSKAGINMNTENKKNLQNLLGIDIRKENGQYVTYFNETGQSISNMTNQLTKMFGNTKEAKSYFGDMGVEELSNAFQTAVLDTGAFTGSLEQLQNRMALLKKSASQVTYSVESYVAATEKADNGANYVKMVQGLKDVKELYEAGLTGTDDFKTFAGWLSPSGATDKKNFAENLPKAERYLTSDKTGVTNMLGDLSSKGYIEKTSSGWKGTLENTKKAADELGVSVGVVEATLERAQDYDFNVNFTSLTEQYTEAEKLLSEWSDAWSKQEGHKQGDKQGKEIENWKQKIMEAKQAGDEIPDEWIKVLQFKVETADYKAELDSIQKDYEAAMSNKDWEEGQESSTKAMKVSAKMVNDITGGEIGDSLGTAGLLKGIEIPVKVKAEANDMLSDIQSKVDQASNLEKGSKARVELEMEIAQDRESFVNYINQFLPDDQKIKVDIEADNSDANKKSDETKKKTEDLDGTTATVNYEGDASGAKQAGNEAEQSKKQGSGTATTTYTGDNTDAQSKANETKQTVKELDGKTAKVSVQTVVDSTDPEKGGLQNFQNGLNELGKVDKTTKVTVGVEADLAEAKNEIANYKKQIETLKSKNIKLKASGNAQQTISSVSKALDKLKGKTIKIKASGNAKSVINSISKALKKLKDKTVKIKVSGNANSVISKIKKALSALKAKTIKVKAKDDASKVIKKVKSGLKSLKNKEVTVSVIDNATSVLSSIKNILDNIKSKSITVTTNYKSNGSPSGGGNLNGNAHFGTSYLTGTLDELEDYEILQDYGDFAYARGTFKGNAYADGHLGAKQSSTSLVGEEAPEMLVRGNRWMLIGQHGAEFRHIKKGDIIFNGDQTKQLLKNGKTPSRGHSYAKGTVSSKKSGFAYASGTSSSSSSKKTALEKYLEKVGKRFDFLAIKLDRLASATDRIAKSITDFSSSTFKANQLWKQYLATGKEITATEKARTKYSKLASTFAKNAIKKAPSSKKTSKKTNQKKLNSYFKKVREGSLDISTITDDNMRSAVEQYQEYYEKVRECTDALQELKNEQREIFNQWLNMPIEKAEKAIEKLSKKYDVLSARQSATSSGGSGIAALRKIEYEEIGAADVTATFYGKQKEKAWSDYQTAKKSSEKKGTSASKAISKQKGLSSKTKKSLQKQIKAGKTISTKGLKGDALKQAKAYNASVKKRKSEYSDYKSVNSKYKEAKDYYNTLKQQQAVQDSFANKPAWEYQNYLLNEQVKNKQSQYNENKKAVKTAEKNAYKYENIRNQKANDVLSNKKAKSQLTKKQLEALEKGYTIDTSNIKDKTLLKQVQAYNKAANNAADATSSLVTAQQNAAISAAELAQAQVDAAKQAQENIKAFYDAKLNNRQGLSSVYESENKLKQARGEDLTQEDYDKVMASKQKERDYTAEKQQKLQEQLDEAVASGAIKKYSQEWYEMHNEINSCASEVNNLDAEMEELADTARQDVYYRGFERALKAIESLNVALDAMNSLIDEDAMFDDKGELTDYGMAAMAMNVKQVNAY